ncbi:MAG: ATP-binding cassette domain-containing protein [Gammaproteobacteria bacterium]|nr:ATP-binding cassette domain-containing protein [Gammaproteobacteria bacterium]MBU1443794.1 ATP-binding cassette domain-containing protein [Gammaproteobacteria bacterium]MBU2288670.1 ATP-binding cassette domain-containing protein [Gammaproteobacteria bacterium]MBU2410369.1 ATP-binding cassette domain-containing protein [Gammaproteobacteria bacterium]
MTGSLLELTDLRFAWPGNAKDCLDIAELQVAPGETLFLHGPSGCGKSTLLSLLAGVLLPRAGRVALLGTDWTSLRSAARDRHRVDHVGYIFQQFNLLPYLSALDNVLLPCRFSARRRDAAVLHAGSERAAAEHWLTGMGLDASVWRRQAQTLSVGQQQRVAAARALVGQPDLVIADEPTSALDEDRRQAFLDLLLSACATGGTALVFVSHDRRNADRFGRQVSLPAINRAARAEEAAA